MSLNIDEIVNNLGIITKKQFDVFQLRKILEEYTIANMEMDRSSYLYDENTDGSIIHEILAKVLKYIVENTSDNYTMFKSCCDLLDNTCFPDLNAYIQYLDEKTDAG